METQTSGWTWNSGQQQQQQSACFFRRALFSLAFPTPRSPRHILFHSEPKKTGKNGCYSRQTSSRNAQTRHRTTYDFFLRRDSFNGLWLCMSDMLRRADASNFFFARQPASCWFSPYTRTGPQSLWTWILIACIRFHSKPENPYAKWISQIPTKICVFVWHVIIIVHRLYFYFFVVGGITRKKNHHENQQPLSLPRIPDYTVRRVFGAKWKMIWRLQGIKTEYRIAWWLILLRQCAYCVCAHNRRVNWVLLFFFFIIARYHILGANGWQPPDTITESRNSPNYYQKKIVYQERNFAKRPFIREKL